MQLAEGASGGGWSGERLRHDVEGREGQSGGYCRLCCCWFGTFGLDCVLGFHGAYGWAEAGQENRSN